MDEGERIVGLMIAIAGHFNHMKHRRYVFYKTCPVRGRRKEGREEGRGIDWCAGNKCGKEEMLRRHFVCLKCGRAADPYSVAVLPSREEA